MIRERGSKINAAGGRGKKRAHVATRQRDSRWRAQRGSSCPRIFHPVGVDIGDTSSLKGLVLD